MAESKTSTPEPAAESTQTSENASKTNAEKDLEAAATASKDAAATQERNKLFMSRLKQAHRDASSPLEFIKSFFLILFHTIGFLIVVLILLGVPIAMIAVGVINRSECPAQSFVPIWLYVGGSTLAFMQLIFLLRSGTKRAKKKSSPEEHTSTCYSSFNLLISIFTFAWFIAGNVWVFRIFQPNTEDPNVSNYCHAGSYYFSFVLIIVAYVWMLLICCCSSCVTLAGIHPASTSGQKRSIR